MKKPITEQRSQGLLRGRDAIWYCIRILKQFSLTDIEILSTDDSKTDNLNRATIRSYVNGLERGCFIEKVSSSVESSNQNNWKLVRDIGIHAPRLDKNGNELPETKRTQMWRSIRILGSFDIQTVVSSINPDTDIKYNDVKDYIKHLNKAGYLVVTEPAKNSGTTAKYRLLPSMNTGPNPPVVQRIKQVFDPNLNKVTWPKDGK